MTTTITSCIETYSVVSEGLPEEKVLEAYEKTRKYFNMALEAILSLRCHEYRAQKIL